MSIVTLWATCYYYYRYDDCLFNKSVINKSNDNMTLLEEVLKIVKRNVNLFDLGLLNMILAVLTMMKTTGPAQLVHLFCSDNYVIYTSLRFRFVWLLHNVPLNFFSVIPLPWYFWEVTCLALVHNKSPRFKSNPRPHASESEALPIGHPASLGF